MFHKCIYIITIFSNWFLHYDE